MVRVALQHNNGPGHRAATFRLVAVEGRARTSLHTLTTDPPRQMLGPPLHRWQCLDACAGAAADVSTALVSSHRQAEWLEHWTTESLSGGVGGASYNPQSRTAMWWPASAAGALDMPPPSPLTQHTGTDSTIGRTDQLRTQRARRDAPLPQKQHRHTLEAITAGRTGWLRTQRARTQEIPPSTSPAWNIWLDTSTSLAGSVKGITKAAWGGSGRLTITSTPSCCSISIGPCDPFLQRARRTLSAVLQQKQPRASAATLEHSSGTDTRSAARGSL
jgi:hypothetical protein